MRSYTHYACDVMLLSRRYFTPTAYCQSSDRCTFGYSHISRILIRSHVNSRPRMPQQVAMNKKIEAQIQDHLDMENEIDEVHASGAELECATPVVSNTKSPDWSYCCDVTSTSRKYFLLEVRLAALEVALACSAVTQPSELVEGLRDPDTRALPHRSARGIAAKKSLHSSVQVFDEDSIYYVNDYLGAAVLSTDSAEGQYELELAGGYDQGTINVLLVTSKHAPVRLPAPSNFL